MSEFCEEKGIKKEFSVARTPQQNGVAERRNRTLIEAARTMLADSKLPTIFWAEAVNTACYVQNKVLVVKPYNKTPYELFRGRTPALSFMRPFGCYVTILNTLDYLGKFNGKSDEGFFIGYSMNSKAFRIYKIKTRKVEEKLHIRFLEDKPIIASDGPKWLFDIDFLTKLMNYVPVVAGTNSNDFVESPMKNSTQDVNTARPSINTASTSVNTGSLNINVVSPTVTTALLEATHVDFFGRVQKRNPSIKISKMDRTMQEELLQFTLQQVYKNNKDERGIVIRNKARLVAQGYTSRKRNRLYDEMDVKNVFLYGKIEEEVYVCQPPGFEDPEFPDKVYKVEKALYGLFSFLELGMMTLANISWIMVFREMSSIGELTFFLGLQVTQKDDGIFISQDKYMDEILKKFGFSTMKTASTPMETSKPLMKDENAEDVDVHLYRSMIVSLMYLTSSRPVIMFAACACARF
ncbi:retrovirus-related pol polyprotein from transposon TNT 1-94 [Tanacetum coccineum]|uniref:Retrovirus-related pol polyprotein from transposon TNT 1-94 n=1 Tax=Tanacetum coccineum TaxID=301880 RepID=A0ABQ5ET52_9ASTR